MTKLLTFNDFINEGTTPLTIEEITNSVAKSIAFGPSVEDSALTFKFFPGIDQNLLKISVTGAKITQEKKVNGESMFFIKPGKVQIVVSSNEYGTDSLTVNVGKKETRVFWISLGTVFSQLKILDASKTRQLPEDVSTIKKADQATLIFYTSANNLQFESSNNIVNPVFQKEKGRYLIYHEGGSDLITVKNPVTGGEGSIAFNQVFEPSLPSIKTGEIYQFEIS
jgi:hypothetical protein